MSTPCQTKSNSISLAYAIHRKGVDRLAQKPLSIDIYHFCAKDIDIAMPALNSKGSSILQAPRLNRIGRVSPPPTKQSHVVWFSRKAGRHHSKFLYLQTLGPQPCSQFFLCHIFANSHGPLSFKSAVFKQCTLETVRLWRTPEEASSNI